MRYANLTYKQRSTIKLIGIWIGIIATILRIDALGDGSITLMFPQNESDNITSKILYGIVPIATGGMLFAKRLDENKYR